MKARWAWVVVAAQLALLVFMAGEREWIARTGQDVWLRTAPIDPRDPFRGDYVRLDYEASFLPRALAGGDAPGWFAEQLWLKPRALRDRKVYAALAVRDDGLAEVTGWADRAPSSGLFLRGRVERIEPAGVFVRYGIEAMFMEQGTARALEDLQRGERAGVPLRVRVAIGGRGIAVLREHRWEPLGITVTPERRDTGDPRRRMRLEALTIELKNHAPHPVAIALRPGAGSFRLLRNERVHGPPWRWVGEDRPVPPTRPEDVVLLGSGERRAVRIDLLDLAWAIVALPEPATDGVSPLPAGRPLLLPDLADRWDVSCRIEYVPPSAGERAALPHGDALTSRGLRSRAFNPAGMVD